MGVKPLREPSPLVDELASLLDQETQRSRFHTVRIEAPQCFAMLSKKVDQQAGITWIALCARGSEALTIIG